MNIIDVLIAAGWTQNQLIGAGIVLTLVLILLGLACSAKTGEEQVQQSERRALGDELQPGRPLRAMSAEPTYQLGDDTMAMLHGVSIAEFQRMCADAEIRQAGGAR